MADVTITYQGRTISEFSESTTRALKTKGRFCTDDIVVAYQKDGGGLTIDIDGYVLEEPMPVYGFNDTSVWDGTTGTSGQYIDNNGNVVESETSITSPFIPVSQGDVYIWHGTSQTTSSSSHRVHAFDANGNWLFMITSVAPAPGAAYSISFSINQSNVTQIKMSCISGDTNVSVVKQPYNYSGSLWNGKTGAIDGAINASGEIVAPGSPAFVYSPLIPASVGQTFVFCGYGVSGFSTTFRVHGYNASGNWVEQIVSVTANNNNFWFAVPVTISAPITGVRITCGKDSKEICFFRVG